MHPWQQNLDLDITPRASDSQRLKARNIQTRQSITPSDGHVLLVQASTVQRIEHVAVRAGPALVLIAALALIRARWALLVGMAILGMITTRVEHIPNIQATPRRIDRVGHRILRIDAILRRHLVLRIALARMHLRIRRIVRGRRTAALVRIPGLLLRMAHVIRRGCIIWTRRSINRTALA